MAAVFNKTTNEYLSRVDPINYPVADWIINPDVSALSAVPKKYWKASGDTVIEMTQAEKDAVDLPVIQARLKDAVDIKTDDLIHEGFDYSGVGSTTEVPNGLLLQLAAINEGKALKSSIDAATTPAEAQAITDSRTLTILQTVVDAKIIEQP